MRLQNAAALVMVCLPSTLLTASCLQSTGVESPTPPEEQSPLASTPPGDEAVGEAPEDLSLLKIVRCTDGELGAACERKCDAAGIWCPSRLTHPYNPEAGPGELFQCRGVLLAQSCWYYYESIQEKCVRGTLGRGVTLCTDQNERP